MNNRQLFLVALVSILVLGCASVPSDISVLTQWSSEREYKDFVKNIATNKEQIHVINADNLVDFLERFSPLYSMLYRDARLSDWYGVVGIGNARDLSLAQNNMNELINSNTSSFWSLHEKSQGKEKIPGLEYWEEIFEREKTDLAAGRNLGDIRNEIVEIQNKILKNNSNEFYVLIDQEKLFARLFTLRNEYAKKRGFPNHINSIFSQDKLNEYEKVYKEIRNHLPRQIESKKNIRGLMTPQPSEYFSIVSELVKGFGLAIDKEKVRRKKRQ